MERGRLAILRTTIKFILIIVVMGSAPVIALSNLVIMEETAKARQRYVETLDAFRQSQGELRGVEDKLRRLTSSVDAVEVEVRQQLRMVKPGEALILIRQEETPPAITIQSTAHPPTL